MDNGYFIFAVSTIGFLGFIFIFGYRNEKKLWNNGFCMSCKNEWEYFDTDSQGGRGYKCRCGGCIWISYPVDVKACGELKK